MARDRGLRFVTLISIVFCISIIDTGRVEARGACHYFSVVARNWTGALNICMGMSMCLADFDTPKHFEILNSLSVSHSEYWFGLNKHFQPKWSYVTNKFKKPSLPAAHNLNADHHCGLVKAGREKTFTVRSDDCGETKMFVCAESVFCKQKREFSRYSSGYNSLPMPEPRRHGTGCGR
ncbi:uncharacterized protein LOC111079746 [Drosophila obscura]|uniref:uncharacterized protein LOC111079746 n=1 Tax=Drosophila obscura TaxID=7282 RepID=UPI000BA0437A|nr:uncharacterized protein LOC111079746 [Drosophila obscura]